MTITGGIIGIMALAGLKLFDNQSKAQKTVEKNYEVSSEVEQIRSILSLPDNCTATFSGQPPEGGTTQHIKKEVNGTFENLIAVDQSLPSGIKVLNYTLTRTSSTLASNETNLKIVFSRGKGTLKEDVIRFVRIVYVLNASNNIMTCHSVVTDTSFWKASPVDATNIYYSAGRVGVGTLDPVARLDVAGQIKIGGLGTCNAPNEGSLAYDSTSKSMKFCDGTTWRSVSSDLDAEYLTACQWGGNNPTSTCTPPACPGSDSDLGFGCENTSSLWVGASGSQAGNCYRKCLTSFPEKRHMRMVMCEWSNLNTTPPNCGTIPSCSTDDIDKGTYCTFGGSSVGGPTGTSWGKCVRQCFMKKPTP